MKKTACCCSFDNNLFKKKKKIEKFALLLLPVGHDNDRVYVFDGEKLKRIAKKYGCILGNKLSDSNSGEDEASNHGFADKPTTKTSSSGITEKMQQSQIIQKGFSEKETKLEVAKEEKQVETPLDVVPVVHSSANCSFEELASKTKGVYRLTMNCYGTETCVVCGVKRRPDWQVTQFDDSWGFLCGACGLKLSEKLGKSD